MIVQFLHSFFKQETIYISFSVDFKENMNICFSEQWGKWVRVGHQRTTHSPPTLCSWMSTTADTLWCWQNSRPTKVIGNKVPIMAYACTALRWYTVLQHTYSCVGPMERQVGLFRMFPPCPVKLPWNPERNLVKTFVRCNLFAAPTGMTSFLEHVVLITCNAVKHRRIWTNGHTL